jgi:hypothetical protein
VFIPLSNPEVAKHFEIPGLRGSRLRRQPRIPE